MWKINEGVQFISHVAAVGEALQMDHQDGGQRPQVQLFGGLLVLLTVRTVPERQVRMSTPGSVSNRQVMEPPAQNMFTTKN